MRKQRGLRENYWIGSAVKDFPNIALPELDSGGVSFCVLAFAVVHIDLMSSRRRNSEPGEKRILGASQDFD